MKMRVLTLTQPWATLMASGAKRIETRSWRTDYRGPVAIHAAKGFPKWAQEIAASDPFVQAYIDYGPGLELVRHDKGSGADGSEWYTVGPDATVDLPTGVIVAVVDLFQIRPTDSIECKPDPRERLFGDYSPGRFAWYTSSRTRLVEPIPYSGGLGLRHYDLPDDVELTYPVGAH